MEFLEIFLNSFHLPVRRQESFSAVLGFAFVAVVAGVRLLVRAEVAGSRVGAAAPGEVTEVLLGGEQGRTVAGRGGDGRGRGQGRWRQTSRVRRWRGQKRRQLRKETD